jgi:hypothetical protein
MLLTIVVVTAQPNLPVVELAGNGIQIGTAVAVDQQGNSFLAGYTDSPALSVSATTANTVCPGGTNVFIVKFAAGTLTPDWVRCFGGSWDDRATAIAVAHNAIYIAGFTNSPNFPAGSRGIVSAAASDGFITKLSLDGASIVWSVLIGGSSSERIHSLHLAASGDLYFGGQTESVDLPVIRAFQSGLSGVEDGMLGRINASGELYCLTYLGGSGRDRISNLRTDSNGNVYATGATDSVDFPTVAALIKVRPGPNSGFIVKLPPDGSRLTYATYLGGSSGVSFGSEEPTALAVAGNGTAYVGGVTMSSDFPVANAFQSQRKGSGTDGYIAALSADGSNLIFSTYIGGSVSDQVTAIALDESAGTLLVAASTLSVDFPGSSPGWGTVLTQFSTTGVYRGVLAGSDRSLFVAALALSPAKDAYVVAGTKTWSGDSAPTAFAGRCVSSVARSPTLIWQNDIARSVTVHYFGGAGGAVFQNWNWLNVHGSPGWRVVAAADFNGDRFPDLVWQNEVTKQVTLHFYGGAEGAVFQGWTWLNTGGAPGWRVVAAADFNNDGTPDLVWQNETTRQVTIHYFGGANGSVFQDWAWLNPMVNAGWRVAGAADFNRDGTPDLVWQSDTTRQVTVHYYGGTGGAVLQGWDWLNTGGFPGWRVAGAWDFNLDGAPDLVWQNDATRQVTVNYFGGAGGTVFQGWNWLTSSGPPGWTAVALTGL